MPLYSLTINKWMKRNEPFSNDRRVTSKEKKNQSLNYLLRGTRCRGSDQGALVRVTSLKNYRQWHRLAFN